MIPLGSRHIHYKRAITYSEITNIANAQFMHSLTLKRHANNYSKKGASLQHNNFPRRKRRPFNSGMAAGILRRMEAE